MSNEHGQVSFRGYHLWYGVAGERSSDDVPVLVVHGGPGSTHDYLENLVELARPGRPVVFFDQLGSGNSDHPSNPSLWTIPLFLDQIDAVRRALALEEVHLLGQSWGGMLGLEYAITRPRGLRSLVVANAPPSIPHLIGAIEGLRAQLPRDVRETLARHEAAGTTEDTEYLGAVLAFYNEHVCRLRRWPNALNRSFAKQAQSPEVYRTMFGRNELRIDGTLREWTVVDRLGQIGVPTLVLSGRYDHVTPEIAAIVHQGIPGAEWVLFEESSHMPHLEESGRFLQVVDNFLGRVEKSLDVAL